LDEALAANKIDAAIHSMKDLPTTLPPGQVLCCVPSREDPRDAFISAKADDLSRLPMGAVVGTASLRRQAQTLHLRPDLRIVPLRGNVETRLAKLATGAVDATFLALAGLMRLGLENNATALVSSEEMPPAAGQGALAVTCRADDHATQEVFARLTIAEFEIATTAERAFLDALDGSCRTPIGALGRVQGQKLVFIGEVLTPDGSKRWRRTAMIALGADPSREAEALGKKLGNEIRAEAGEAFRFDKGELQR
jgi:hydroxymethylbilane synthase